MLEKFAERLFFLHIPKTGGTTLHAMLLEYFSSEDVCPERNHSVILLPPQEIQQYLFFSAHAPYDLIRRLPKPARIISIFRNPLERAVSDYFFLRRFAQDTPEQRALLEPRLARAFNFADYLNWDNRFFQEQISNKHFIFLCGHRYVNPDGVPWRGESEMLDVGYMRIESMDCVGITEYMPASVESIWRKLGLRPPAKHLQLNKRNSGIDVADEVSSSVLERLEEINRIDTKLYAFAKARFLADPANRIFPVYGFYSQFAHNLESSEIEARYTSGPGEYGYCLFGPYIQLGAGSYTCTFDISFDPSAPMQENETIATMDVSAINPFGNSVVFASKRLTMSQWSGGRLTETVLDFTLEKSQDSLEFRLYVEGRGNFSAKAKVMITIN